MTPITLTIAGSDPSGGAGIQADLKTFHQRNVYGMSVLTLPTVQNTRSVDAVEPLAPGSWYGGAAAKNPFGFAHLLAALDFMQRGPLEIVFAGDRAQPAIQPLVETVHRTYQPSRVLAFADDVPIDRGRGPIDGKPAAYVCRNRTCEAPLTSAEALRERCTR
jgi:uncharacterized protein YyaL (SSP411 family)